MRTANTLIGLRNLPIGLRLTAGFGLLLLLTLIISAISIVLIDRLGDTASQMYEHPLTVGYQTRDIRGYINAMSRIHSRLGHPAGREQVEEAMRQVRDLDLKTEKAFAVVLERFLGDRNDTLAAIEVYRSWKPLRDEKFKMLMEGDPLADDPVLERRNQASMDDLLAKVQLIIDFARNKAASFQAEAQQAAIQSRIIMLVLLGLFIPLGLLVMFVVHRSIAWPLSKVLSGLKEIARGDFEKELDLKQQDEFGAMADAFRDMQASLRNKLHVAEGVAVGEFSRRIELAGEADRLGLALIRMTEALRQARQSSEADLWLKSGLSELASRMVGTSDTHELGRAVLSYLAGHLGASIGALYLSGPDGALTLCASHAFNLRKELSQDIRLGQGLVGQAALEKDLISITNVPDDYLRINSALGDSAPRNIVAMPFLFEGRVGGVIELASLEEIATTRLTFLRTAAQAVGVAFSSQLAQARVAALLTQSQEQTLRLQTQEEELRVANEELEEQARNLRQSEEELRQQQEELQTVNEELSEKNRDLEEQQGYIGKKNRELEQARLVLEQKARELENTSRYKSEFLANMSHELRTPLNSILLLARSLADNKQGALADRDVEAARIIHKSGNDLLSLIDEILDLSKIEAGRVALNLTDVPLADVAASLREQFEHPATEKGLDFEIVIEEGLPRTVNTDAQRFEQILRNFLSNALKFTARGGLHVRFFRPAPGTRFTRLGLDPARVLAVSVRDTGIGISPDKHREIFEAFRQLDGGVSRQYGGTGLGLSIARELTKLLGGEIQLASVPDQGATFTVFIPENRPQCGLEAKPGPAPAPQAPAPEPAPRKPQAAPVLPDASIPDDRDTLAKGERSILIIEDDDDFAQVLSDLCRDKGFKALVSPTGEGGLALAARHLPSAVILDITLPGMDGWAVLEQLKADPATRHIPVHVASGTTASMDGLGKGALGFLAKPISPEDLEAAFRQIGAVMDKAVKDLLVVEDSPAIRRAVADLLGGEDVRITEASSGGQALDLLGQRQFDCIILDLGLPDMTGFEFLDRMKAAPRLTPPPVVVYTGRDLTREEESQLRAHAQSIIVKGARSEERLLDETMLFLHRMVDTLPAGKQQMLSRLYGKDAVLENRTVLVVDDDMRNLFAVCRILEEKGMTTIKAEDGKKALNILEENPCVDLVLLDIMMPVMDGYQTLAELRKRPEFARLPVLALTAKAMKEDREKCLAAGASDYLAKPVDADRLLSMLRVWLYKK